MTIGLAIPGRPVVTTFQSVGAGGPGDQQTRLIAEVPRPGEVADLCVFLTQALPSPDMGISVYYSSLDGNWQFLGAVHNQKPTAILRTSWPLNADVNRKPTVLVGLVMEPSSEILEKLKTTGVPLGDEIQKVFAKKVALNLFRFLESWNIPGFPVQALDRWYTKFEEKFSVDPSFVLRTE